MKYVLPLIIFSVLTLIISSCKKDKKEVDGCLPGAVTIRQIVNKKAVVKLNATIYGVFIIEEGTIDTRLVPCNLLPEFYQNDLQVIISGDVKSAPKDYSGPCCTNFFAITKITK